MPALIHWPERYNPECAPIHVRNEIDTRASPELVWAWLVRAPLWPTWYPNSRNVRVAGWSSDLSAGAHFTWRTFGVAIRSAVVEFIPPERIAWSAFGLGVDAYHAWLVSPTSTGSHILTEETQYGWAARLGSRLFPSRMSRFHQLWLERLSALAESGGPSQGPSN